jgi:hypothetical protein
MTATLTAFYSLPQRNSEPLHQSRQNSAENVYFPSYFGFFARCARQSMLFFRVTFGTTEAIFSGHFPSEMPFMAIV